MPDWLSYPRGLSPTIDTNDDRVSDWTAIPQAGWMPWVVRYLNTMVGCVVSKFCLDEGQLRSALRSTSVSDFCC